MKPKFLIQPSDVPLDDGLYINQTPWRCPIAPFVVPAGFIYSHASVPWLVSWMIPSDGRIRAASLAHDYLYEHKGIVKGFRCTRVQADMIFQELGRMAHVSNIDVAYAGVRAFGWMFWG